MKRHSTRPISQLRKEFNDYTQRTASEETRLWIDNLSDAEVNFLHIYCKDLPTKTGNFQDVQRWREFLSGEINIRNTRRTLNQARWLGILAAVIALFGALSQFRSCFWSSSPEIAPYANSHRKTNNPESAYDASDSVLIDRAESHGIPSN